MHLLSGLSVAQRGPALLTLFLALAMPLPVIRAQSFGNPPPSASGTVRSVSEKFREKEVRRLYELLNSAEFQASLTNYNCGDQVPKLKFSVYLQPKARASARYVGIDHWPGQSPSGRSRCLFSSTALEPLGTRGRE